jgi:hypothetical protein
MAFSIGLNMEIELEYRVKPVTRYVVTRYTRPEANHEHVPAFGMVEVRGEYDNQDVAHEVAYALCASEHQALGWSPGDERVKYPQNMVAGQSAEAVKT